jgi:capsular polysaccharide biosynthesis protein
MEVRRYLTILRDHWVVVSLAFSLTLAGSIALVAQQPWIYESSGTYIVRPRAEAAGEIVAAFTALSRGVEINSTYAAIARSDAVFDAATEALGVSATGLSVSAEVITGTNMIRISVRGQEPERLRSFAQAVGEAAVQFVGDMDDAYLLQLLDEASEPHAPVGPNKALTIVAAAVFGLMLGGGLAFMIDSVSGLSGFRVSFEALDPKTGAFNGEYFNLRLKEEVARMEETGQGFVVGHLRLRDREDVNRSPRPKRIREVVELISTAIRTHDVLCASEPGTLVIIFPGLTEADCVPVLDDWRTTIEGMYESRPISVDTEIREYVSVTARQAGGSSINVVGG